MKKMAHTILKALVLIGFAVNSEVKANDPLYQQAYDICKNEVEDDRDVNSIRSCISQKLPQLSQQQQMIYKALEKVKSFKHFELSD